MKILRKQRAAFILFAVALFVLLAILFCPRLVNVYHYYKTLTEGKICLNNGDYETALRNATIILKERPIDERARKLKKDAEEALSWLQPPNREAGFRQTLKIGNAEYGFVWIPAGEFEMGSPETEKGRDDDEVLHHVVLTRGFWMLETEVTQALYQEIMGTNPSKFEEGDNFPVETVSWDDSMEFCAELTKRLPKGLTASLPTEAQWEYVARAGTKTAYWYGDAADSNKMNNIKWTTTPVKSYAPNAWGLYDMHGNVWEWALDYYGAYPTGTVTDPKGPDSASDRVNRGGSWNDYAGSCRSADRLRRSPGRRGGDLGFRFLLSCD